MTVNKAELAAALSYAKEQYDKLTPKQKKELAEKVKDPHWRIRAAWGDMAEVVIANRKSNS